MYDALLESSCSAHLPYGGGARLRTTWRNQDVCASRGIRPHTSAQSARNGSNSRSHRMFLMIGENATLPDSFFLNYTRDKGSTQHGINMVAPDFLYDPASRKVLFRSAVLREVDDISELRLGRAPGKYPNTIDFNGALPPFAVIGQVGFEAWQGGRRGYGALKAAIQGAAAADPGLSMLYLATATGRSGRSPDGSSE